MDGIFRGPARVAGVVLAGGLLLSTIGCASRPQPLSMTQRYAQDYHVSLAEAERRFAHIQQLGDSHLEQRLRAERPDTFAGLYIEHLPVYRVVVRFTGDAQTQLAAYTDDPLYVAQTAPRTLLTLTATQKQLGERLHAAGIEYMSDMDVKNSQVIIHVLDVDQAMKHLADLPVMHEGYVRVHKTKGFIELT